MLRTVQLAEGVHTNLQARIQYRSNVKKKFSLLVSLGEIAVGKNNKNND